MKRTVEAHFHPENGEPRIALRFAEGEARPDIVLSTGEAALLAVEIQQVLGECMLHSRPPGVKRRLSLKFSRREN